MFNQQQPLKMNLLDDDGGAGTPPEAPPADVPPADTPDLPDFLKGIDADLAGEPMLKNYKDMNTLVKSLVHAQKSIGKNKLVIPTAKSSKDEWDAAFKALGKPEKLEDYGIDTKKSKLGEDLTKSLLEEAFNNNLLPNQVKALTEFLGNKMSDSTATAKEQFEAKQAEAMENLKAEWGEGYKSNLDVAKQALNEFADEDFKGYLKDSGMDKDVNLIKFLNKIGKAMGNDEFHGKGSETFNLTTQEVQDKISQLRANPAAYDRYHADHKRVITEMENLYKKLK